MRFNSKKDFWIGLLVWLAIGGGFIGTIFSGQWTIILVMLLTLLFFAWIWFGTYYVITEEILIVRTGPFKWSIKIKEIRTIKKTRNPLSSAALSLDRIEIKYSKYGYTLISPIEVEAFTKELKKINPNIQVEL